MNKFDSLTGMIEKIVSEYTRFFVPRIGRVSRIDDPEEKGRILVHIPIFSWDNDSIGAWCWPKGNNSIVLPSVDDYVLVEFVNGDRDFPVYSGLAYQMKNMLPENFSGKDDKIIFEDSSGVSFVKYNESEKKFTIQDSHGNKIEMKSGEVSISGSNIKILSGTESFLKGDTFNTWLTTVFMVALSSHVHTLVQTGVDISGPPSPGTFTAPVGHLSTNIKGE